MGITFSGGVQIFMLLLWSGISIAMITIGVMYRDKCFLQPLIPVYLMVAGSSHLLAILLVPLKYFCHQLSAVLEGSLLMFVFCWLIAGSTWVFPVYFVYPLLCDNVLYRFSFGILLFQYTCIAVVSVTLVLVFCFTGVKINPCSWGLWMPRPDGSTTFTTTSVSTVVNQVTLLRTVPSNPEHCRKNSCVSGGQENHSDSY
ncbi:transmembrane protein 272-like isoform X2 [Dendropsophus ebraccatus]|uniref:transmembrane protein 272-like isoform X2 n=1 Tax=Dendropsophus ebraccatus TaxID=150705 RepID=UPI00383160C6